MQQEISFIVPARNHARDVGDPDDELTDTMIGFECRCAMRAIGVSPGLLEAEQEPEIARC